MRISDWSSDVCSSDLLLQRDRGLPADRLCGVTARTARGRVVERSEADAGSDVDLRQVKAAGLTQLLVNSLTVAGHDADVRVSGDRLLDRLLQRHSMSRQRQWKCQGRSKKDRLEMSHTSAAIPAHASFPRHKTLHPIPLPRRSEELRVGKEGISKFKT